MDFRVNLLWKLILPLKEGVDYSSSRSGLFRATGGKTFVRALGGDFRINSAPVVLTPTDLFHKAMRATQDRLGVEGKRFPYRCALPHRNEAVDVNFSIRIHDGVICVTVRVAPFQINGDVKWAVLQDLRSNKLLWGLVRKILAISFSDDRNKGLSQEPQIFPAIHIQALDRDPSRYIDELVGAVTRHPNVNADVVAKVLDKNRAHWVDDTLLIIDKQGIGAYVHSDAGDGAARMNLDRFENSVAMLELASIARLRLRNRIGVAADLESAVRNPKGSITASVSGLKIWSLLVSEFSLLELLNSLNCTEGVMPGSVHQESSLPPSKVMETTKIIKRILILTVTQIETKALREALSAETGRQPNPFKAEDLTYQNFGNFGDYEIIHQISGMGSGGIDGSQETIRRSIVAVQPFAVVMVGIAFGAGRKKTPLGTILVSKSIQSYDLQRINGDASIALRGDKVTASPVLLNWVSHAQSEWPESGAEVKVGLILSGDKLVDNVEYRDKILAAAPDAIGGEMEGAGLYVASQTSKVEWLLIKSVCDWADGKKSLNKDSNQRTAAKWAAEFAVHLLRVNSRSPC